MAMCSPLRLAWQASCCRVHAVAMVSAGAAPQCFASSICLGCQLGGKCCDSTHFLSGGWHPSCCHSRVSSLAHIVTIPVSSSDTRLESKADCCLATEVLHQFGGKNNIRKAEQICSTPAKRPRCRTLALGARKNE